MRTLLTVPLAAGIADLLYIGITLVFFAIAVAYVAGCDRLSGGES